MRPILALLLALVPLSALAEMRGHGGPVRAIAVSADGKTAVTGSFDTTIIVWNLEAETARLVLRFHEGPVSGIVFSGERFFSSSDDGRIALWDPGLKEPTQVFGQRGSPVVGLTAQGSIHADHMFRMTQGRPELLPAGPISITTSNKESVVGLANASLLWMLSRKSVTLPTNANALASAPDGEIIVGGADGKLHMLAPDGSIRQSVEVQELPITSLAVSADGTLIAAAGLRGAVKIIERSSGREMATLVGPGLPVWSLAFHPGGKMLLTGGADRILRKWDVATGQPLSPAHAPKADFSAAVMNERGAQVFRACEACHTVTPDGGNRAGPTLHGVFGRRIGTAKDYVYSESFGKHPITWNADSIARLFREGPSTVTPGTKMPEQTISDPEDLQALVQWLEKVTREHAP